MRLMLADTMEPVNIGSSERISMNNLARMALAVNGLDETKIRLVHKHGPVGV